MRGGGGGDPPGSVSVPHSVPDSAAVGDPISNPMTRDWIHRFMSFQDNLQLALGRRLTRPAASEPDLPRELQLGEYAWWNGKNKRLQEAEGGRAVESQAQAASCPPAPRHLVEPHWP